MENKIQYQIRFQSFGKRIHLMLTKLLNHRLTSRFLSIKRSDTVRSKSDVGMSMKLFNDQKQFGKTLELFDQYKEHNIGTYSSLTITQALKACAHTGDLRRGLAIHQAISSRVQDDNYILVSLIHMYSKFVDEISLVLFDLTQCNVVILSVLNRYSIKR